MSEGTATAQRLNELLDIEESQRLFMAACRPSRTLLEGMKYVPAAQPISARHLKGSAMNCKCNHDCNEGRDCPNEPDENMTMTCLVVSVCAVALIFAALEFAQWMGLPW
jgi:hypothetical protein